MKDIKYPPVAIIKGIDVPFILIERAFSVPFYALLNSKTVIFELCHSWIKWATCIMAFKFLSKTHLSISDRKAVVADRAPPPPVLHVDRTERLGPALSLGEVGWINLHHPIVPTQPGILVTGENKRKLE